jgi:hypothetical protein
MLNDDSFEAIAKDAIRIIYLTGGAEYGDILVERIRRLTE